MTTSPVHISLEKSQMLKGLAIIAVVTIHTLAYFPGIYTTSKYQLIFILIDQLGRFCVPIFLLLSGYGLALRHKEDHPRWWTFFQKRVLKLVPLYFVWSVVSYVLLSIVPAWKYVGQPQAMWYQLITGSADYQMYFVLLIFELYALFPLLLRCVKKFPSFTLLFSFFIQLALFSYYSSKELPGQYNLDGIQYLCFGSWIGYFVLGIWLAIKPIPTKLFKLFLPMTLLSATLVVWNSWRLIGNHTDPLLALKFTRWPVTLYAVSVIMWLISRSSSEFHQREIVNRVQKVLNYFGQESYLIFLAHTIALRILFSALKQLVSLPVLLLLVCTWLATILFSKKLNMG